MRKAFARLKKNDSNILSVINCELFFFSDALLMIAMDWIRFQEGG